MEVTPVLPGKNRFRIAFQYQPPRESDRALYLVKNDISSREKNSTIGRVVFKYTGNFSECQAAIEKAFEHVDKRIFKKKFILVDGETSYKTI